MAVLPLRVFLGGFFLALTASAQATLHVPGDHATIQAAIVAAAPGDTVLVAPGTYVEELDYLGKAITVASESGAAATILTNVNSAVSFVNGEGRNSILRGFTVTGHDSGQAAIHGPGTSPRIVQCVIRDNRTSFGLAAGVHCDGTLIDCLIENNSNSSGTGGVAGALTLRRCVLQGNVGYDGAAALLFGGGMEDCLVLANWSAEGSGGGAVSIASPYPVTLTRCLIAGNTKDTWSGQYAANGAGLKVQTLSIPAVLENCTVVGNLVPVPGSFGDDHGGIHGLVTLRNCIVRGNDGLDFEAAVTSATYSNLEGVLTGTGNFDLDPLFRDAPSGDYRLLPGSPCIDAGDPAAPLDLDGTRADVGALEFTHASVFPLSGSGSNPALLASLTLPAIGTNWQATIQASLVAGTTTSGIQVRTGARVLPLVTPFGELLITGPLLGSAQVLSNGTLDAFSFALPADPVLLGLAAHAQGYVLTSTGPRLGNGLTLLVGE